MSSEDYALQVRNVSKSFKLPTEKSNGIKQAVINTLKGIKGYSEQHVLRDISFNVEKGDFFGIVGRNGSGKSTLLKIISQIYEPDEGEVAVNGKLVPFIELGVGFNPELTGRENVYLNGALLGFSHDEMSAMYSEIVEFAELEEFMDQKLKNYSSGMQVRLAFSIAIKAEADILVLDEVLAVGDMAFQRKCFEYFGKLKKNKKTVILVTHDMEAVRQYCNKAILINQGSVVSSTLDVNMVADEYLRLFNKNDHGEGRPGGEVNNDAWGTKEIEVIDLGLKYDGLDIIIDATLKAHGDIGGGFIFAIKFSDIDGTLIAGSSTRGLKKEDLQMKIGESIDLQFKIRNNFGRNKVVIGYHLVDGSNTAVFDSSNEAIVFDNPSRPSYYPVVYDNTVKISKKER